MRLGQRLGGVLVVAGLLLNPWLVGYVATDDHSIGPLHVFALFLFLSAACLLGGLQLFWRWVDRVSWQRPVGAVRGAVVVGAVALVIAGTYWRLASFNERHTHIMLVGTGHDQVTAEQQQWADDFYRRSLAAAIKNGWFDINKATAQGFQADRINRTHYPNLQNMFDDTILDPEHPEWLIYYDTPNGKALMGFMFFTKELNDVGPTPAGPLAQWHYHPYPTPRCAVKGIWTVSRPDTSGKCAEGIPVSRTPEMFHVWFIDHPLGRFTEMNIVPEYWQDNDLDLAKLHPITVHFAIGLFMVAVLLDVVAFLTKKSEFHRAAWINLVLAAVAAVAAVSAGMTAELAFRPTHEAHMTLDVHKQLAFISLGSILLLTAWRYALRGHFPQTGAVLYIVLSLAGVGAIGGAGYYGGEMVYEHAAGVRVFDRFARDQYWEKVREVYLPESGIHVADDPGISHTSATGHTGH